MQNLTITQAYEIYSQYVSIIRNYSKHTINSWKHVVSYFERVSWEKYLNSVTKQTAEKYFLYWRIERKWSSSTYITHLKIMNVLYKWCVKNAYCENNPFSEIEKPSLEKKLPRMLNKEEAELVLNTALHMNYRFRFERYRNHAIIAIILFAGLRRAEVLNLKLWDVDMFSNCINVVQWKWKKDRIVPINNTLKIILSKYLEERKRLNKQCLAFFTSSNRDVGFTTWGLKKFIVKLRDKCKLNFSIHSLRHTFATLMLEWGCDIYALSKLMWHTKISTTTIYLAASTKLLSKSIGLNPLS